MPKEDVTTMTTLDEIQARADAASPAPWRIEKDREEDYEQGIPYSEWPQTLVGPANAYQSQRMKDHGTTHQVDEISELTFPDAEFIAHAREDVPRLVAALRAVEEVCDQWAYKGEFGWGAWQEGKGPSPEGAALDDASAAVRAAIRDALQ